MKKINVGTGFDSDDGDEVRIAGIKINDNIEELVGLLFGQELWGEGDDVTLNLSGLQTPKKTSIIAALNSVYNSRVLDAEKLGGYFPDFYLKGLKPHTPIQLTAGTPHEYILPTNARLHALEIAGASSIIVGTATGLDDIGDYAPTAPSVWQLGFIIANSVFIQSDVDVIVEPIIFQK